MGPLVLINGLSLFIVSKNIIPGSAVSHAKFEIMSIRRQIFCYTVATDTRRGQIGNQINYQIDPDLVSTDIIGDSCCSVFDSNATICTEEGKDVVLYVWYDNEFGYTKQVIRLAKLIAKVRRLTYY